MIKRIVSILAALALWAAPCLRAAGTEDAAQEPAQEHAAAYVLIVTDAQYGALPLPDTEEGAYSYPLRQRSADGTLVYNIIRVTKDGFFVEEASCDNQDCVHQGEVTLENRGARLLGNMVICLPNHLTLSLVTWEELMEFVSSMQAGAGS